MPTALITGAAGFIGFFVAQRLLKDGSGSGVLELLGDVMAPGTLSTNALTVGLGQNLLSNTNFNDGMNGWEAYYLDSHPKAKPYRQSSPTQDCSLGTTSRRSQTVCLCLAHHNLAVTMQ
jgi:hypothetical protein